MNVMLFKKERRKTKNMQIQSHFITGELEDYQTYKGFIRFPNETLPVTKANVFRVPTTESGDVVLDDLKKIDVKSDISVTPIDPEEFKLDLFLDLDIEVADGNDTLETLDTVEVPSEPIISDVKVKEKTEFRLFNVKKKLKPLETDKEIKEDKLQTETGGADSPRKKTDKKALPIKKGEGKKLSSEKEGKKLSSEKEGKDTPIKKKDNRKLPIKRESKKEVTSTPTKKENGSFLNKLKGLFESKPKQPKTSKVPKAKKEITKSKVGIKINPPKQLPKMNPTKKTQKNTRNTTPTGDSDTISNLLNSETYRPGNEVINKNDKVGGGHGE